MRDKNGLTFKQAAFVDHYCGECRGNGVKAAKIAGYAGNDNVLTQIAHKLVSNGKIKLIIQQTMAKVAEKVDVSVEFVVEKLLYGLNVAIERNNTVAMARFLELLGRYKAMFTDNLSTTDTQRQRELDEKASAEAEEFARWRIAQKYGLIGTKAG